MRSPHQCVMKMLRHDNPDQDNANVEGDRTKNLCLTGVQDSDYSKTKDDLARQSLAIESIVAYYLSNVLW